MKTRTKTYKDMVNILPAHVQVHYKRNVYNPWFKETTLRGHYNAIKKESDKLQRLLEDKSL